MKCNTAIADIETERGTDRNEETDSLDDDDTSCTK